MAEKGDKQVKKLSDKVIKISQIMTAITVIVTAIASLCVALDTRFTDRVGEQIAEVKEEMQKNNASTDQKLTRLELMNLIQNQPDNVAEVERVAYHYFIDLKGDWYATRIYSNWAQEYGGDLSLITNTERAD